MSQPEMMEKEFTETELAGGESLVEDEDLTDEEYVEALGEHDADGNEIVSDKPKKVKSPQSSPVHQQKKDADKEVKISKKNEQLEGVKDDQVAVSGPSVDNEHVFDAVDDKEKESTDEKDKAADMAKDDKECTDSDHTDDKATNENEGNYNDMDEEDEVRGEENEREEDEEDERDEDGESIEDGQEDAEDGQENSELSKSNKELDDDEDRRNPQYIPKRGAFYEHDDRLGTDEEEEEEKEPEKDEAASVEKKPDAPVVEVRKAKKLWSDDAKWGHDMFDDEEQRPKPRDEIVSTYGYDIRNEDGPPKARRRRRYGRGPNRYTRSWKDEGAYSKPNDTPIREKAKPDSENLNLKRDKDSNRPFSNADTSEKPADTNKRSGLKGQQQQRRTEVKSATLDGNDRIERTDRNDRIERTDRNDRIERSDRKKPQRERDGRDLGGQHRDNDRYRDRRRNGSNNMSPGPSKDLREFINSKNERLGDRRDDLRRNQSDFFENDFPELPQKSKDKITRPQQHHQQPHQTQTTTLADPNQPNAWSKIRPKHNDARENVRGVESSLDYKTAPLRVGESTDNGKHRSFNLTETNPKIEIVKTQTFENSRYFNRRPLTKGGGHHQEPSNNIKKDLPANRNNRGRTRPANERDFRSSAEVGRPITKTSHLADDHEESGGSGIGGSMEQQRRNRYNVNKERDFRSSHHGSDDRDRRGPEVEARGRSYLHDDRHYDNQFNDNQTDLSGGLNKLTMIEKSNNRLSSLEANDSMNLAKPKRYSSLRQHQAQQQQQPQSEPLSQHKQSQPTPNQQPQPTRDAHQSNSNLPQYPSTSQHLNLNHPRQSTNVQYYEATAGANPQPPPPPPPSASYYIDNRSPQSSFGYIPTTNIEGGPNATRFLSQMAPRFIPPPTAPPPTAPEPRFMAQAVAAANPAAAAGPLPPVIPGPPAATYLPTYPPGYPQYPPPPPPTAAQFSIAPPPPPPPSAAEMYRGGVTYYDTMTQQVSPRQLPQRRPKNALPIVPPPDLSNNPDGMVMNVNQGYEVDENDLNENVETITC